jgi:hypothetical protein
MSMEWKRGIVFEEMLKGKESGVWGNVERMEEFGFEQAQEYSTGRRESQGL